MIDYQQISLKYDNKSLFSDFSLHIAENEKVVFHGPSGSGKTSLMAMIMGFVRPSSGSLFVNGLEVGEETISEIRKLTAWVPQEAALPFEFVKDMVEAPFTYKINKENKPELSRILHYFELLGLSETHYNKRLHEISGGEQQRIMLAIAGLLDKKILLLDEPTSALDGASIDKVIHYLKQMNDTTMLAISHDNGFIESFENQVKIG